VLSPYHAMGCNPVSMVDPLGLQAHTSSWGGGMPTQKDIALTIAPTVLLDRLYGYGLDPWLIFNKNAMLVQAAKDKAVAIAEELTRKSYILSVYYSLVYEEKEREREREAKGRGTDKRRGGTPSSAGKQQDAGSPVNVIEIGYQIMTNEVTGASGTYTESGVEAQFGISNATFTEYQWLQTIATSSTPDGRTSPYLDEASTNSFFYFTSSEIQAFSADLARLGLSGPLLFTMA
jgi:hypothetical protein